MLRTNAGIPAVTRGQSSPNRVSYSEGDEAGNIPSVQFKTKDNARKLKLITQEEDDDSETAAVTSFDGEKAARGSSLCSNKTKM